MKALERDRKIRGAFALLGMIAGMMLLGAGLLSAADEKKDSKDNGSGEPAPGEFNNSITVGGGAFLIDGNKAQFQHIQRSPGSPFGGIEEMHLEQALGKKGLFQIDTRGLLESHDYSIKLDVSQEDVGYVRVGVSQFRSWYDGSGGWSQRSNAWFNLYNDQMHVDRGDAFIEGRLALPDWPVFTVKYHYQYRDGKKDSTIWGDYNLNAPSATTVLRGIVPTWLGIDERRHILEGDVTHTLGKTDVDFGLRYEWSDQNNTRNEDRRPGDPAVNRYVTQRDQIHSDLFNVRGSSQTRINEKVLFTTGAAFTRLDTDIGGSRIYGSTYDAAYNPAYANRQRNDEGFYDLSGGSRSDQYVANLNLMVTPWDNWTFVPALRIEHQDQSGFANFVETAVTNAATAPRAEDLLNVRDRSFTDVTESLDLRYTGMKDWALYARAELTEGQAGLTELETDSETGLRTLFRDTDSSRMVQKYTAGANWYPLRELNLGGQYYYKDRINDYTHVVDPKFYNPPTSTTDLYPAFIRRHDFATHDMNLRVTWRPLANLTLVSRYDYQISTIDTRGDVNSSGIALGLVESSRATTHMFSESVSWVPIARMFIQGSGSYVYDRTHTPTSMIGGATYATVQDADNSYWTANTTVGYALSDKADLLASYNYYRADDYSNNSFYSLPYGTGAEQHGVTTTLLERLRKNLLWKVQYGYFTYRDQQFGGYNNYNAHLVYSSVQLLF